MYSTTRSSRFAFVAICLIALGSSLALSACDVVGQGTYHPAFLPIEFVIDTQGNISVQLSASLATPIGTFGVGAAAENNVKAPSGGIVMFIQHLVGGQPMDAGYQVNEDTSDKTLVIDGNVTVEFTGTIKSVNGIGHHTILLTTPDNLNPSSSSQPDQQAQTDTPVPAAPTDTSTDAPTPASLNMYVDGSSCPLPPSQTPPYRWPGLELSNVSNQVVHWRAQSDGAPYITVSPSQGTLDLGTSITIQFNGTSGPGHSDILVVQVFDASTGNPIIHDGTSTASVQLEACGLG